jgi:hypothetical protein
MHHFAALALIFRVIAQSFLYMNWYVRYWHARYYRLDRELLEEYQDGKVKLKITEQELNSKYKRDRPGYFGQ